MRKNPFQFVEPTFGDGFHLKGATGYSQYSDGTKSPHTVYYADPAAAEQALATFLVLEGAGNLRKTVRVPTSQAGTICVDLPSGRRFFAGNQGADIWIKELVSADGHAAGSQEPTSWNKWSSKGIFPKTTWFQSRASSNPVRHRSQLTAAQRAKRTALWQNKRETKDSSAERLRCQLCGPDKGMSPFGELHVCEDCAKAYDNTNRRERRLPLRQEYLDLEAARTPEADLHEAIEARLSAKVAKRRGEANWAGEPETSNEAARYERRRERRAERRAQEVALKAFQNPVWIRPEGSLRAQRMEAAYDEAYDNPGRAVYAAFAQAAKAKGQTPAQIKSAYAKKKKAEKPVNPVKVTSKVFGEIIDVTKKHIGDPTFLSSAGMMWADPTKMLIKIELASSKYTGWEVDDPKYVAALRAVAKKYKPQGVQMTVAVKNPRN